MELSLRRMQFGSWMIFAKKGSGNSFSMPNSALKIPAGLLKKSGNTLKLKLCGEMKNMLGRGWLGTAAEHVDFVLPEVSLIKYGG